MQFRPLAAVAVAVALATASVAQTPSPSSPPASPMPMQPGQHMQQPMPMQPGQHMQGGPPAGAGPHAQHGQPARADTPATREYKAANAKMHKDMAIRFTGDADKDFAAGMIPHHQGAIDMAKTAIKHGKDPEVRKLAEEIVAAQEKEIARLKAILAQLK